MDFLKFASERYSVRKFRDKHLEKEIIDKIISCAHVAPTGCNKQPQRILVLNTDESCEKLSRCTKYSKKLYSLCSACDGLSARGE